jgi:hypothetical protein
MFRPELVSFLKLIGRSDDVGDGWRKYSDQMKGLVRTNHAAYPGIFEMDDDNNLIRTTAEGNILVKWMNYKPAK